MSHERRTQYDVQFPIPLNRADRGHRGNVLLKACLFGFAGIAFVTAELLTGFVFSRIFGSAAGIVIALIAAIPIAGLVADLCIRIRRRVMPTTVEQLYSRYGMRLPAPNTLASFFR